MSAERRSAVLPVRFQAQASLVVWFRNSGIYADISQRGFVLFFSVFQCGLELFSKTPSIIRFSEFVDRNELFALGARIAIVRVRVVPTMLNPHLTAIGIHYNGPRVLVLGERSLSQCMEVRVSFYGHVSPRRRMIRTTLHFQQPP